MADDRSTGGGLSPQERKAIKERAAEVKNDAKRAKGAEKAAAEEAEVLAKISQMPDGDREMAERLHEIVAAEAPTLAPKLYYGQPGYARGGKVLVFFRSGQMDKLRYSTFGVSPNAALDEPGGLWPTSYAMIGPTAEAWDRIAEIVRRAAEER
ncbi:DUF1801 domain-containing protein [Nakamurella alba]|nr:DUF1801 domain-containing protein [Nakamurella alba]